MLQRPHTRELIHTFRAWKQNARLNQNLKNKLQNAINAFNSRPDPYLRFQDELIRLVNANKRFRYHKYNNNRVNGKITVYYQNNYRNRNNNSPPPPRSFVNFTRANNNTSAYISYGVTHPSHRYHPNDPNKKRIKVGTILRNFGVRAALAAGVPLYQYSINLNMLGLVPSKFGKKKVPISGHIMEKLGAVKVKGIPKGHGRVSKKAHAYMVRAHPYRTRFRPT
jgi:hypothetical protein